MTFGIQFGIIGQTILNSTSQNGIAINLAVGLRNYHWLSFVILFYVYYVSIFVILHTLIYGRIVLSAPYYRLNLKKFRAIMR